MGGDCASDGGTSAGAGVNYGSDGTGAALDSAFSQNTSAAASGESRDQLRAEREGRIREWRRGSMR